MSADYFEPETMGDFLYAHRMQLIFVLTLMCALYYRIVSDMAMVWYDNDNYSHGFIVPFIAAYFLHGRWDDIKKAAVKPSNLGLVVIGLALSQLIVSWLGTEYFNMRVSLVVLMAGITLFLFGWRVLMLMALPLGYLLLMVPIPAIIYNEMAFPLKIFVTKVSIFALKAAGVIVWNEGNIILLPNVTLEVADACSGLRSLMSLFALSTAYAFIGTFSYASRLILIVSAIPIAVTANIFRVIATGFLAQYWGARAAEGFFHEFAGLAVFAMAMVLLIALGSLLKRVGK